MNRLLILLTIFFGINFSSFTQEDKIAILQGQLYEYVVNYDLKNIVKTGEELKRLYKEQKVTDLYEIMHVDIMLINSYPGLFQIQKAKDIYLSYENCLECEKDPIAMSYVSILSSASLLFSSSGDNSKALEINSKAIEVCKKSSDEEVANKLSDLTIERGEFYTEMGNYAEAEKLFLNVTADTTINLYIKIRVHKELSDMYESQNQYSKAIDNSLQLVSLIEKNSDTLFQDKINRTDYCGILMRIGNYYEHMADMKSSIYYTKKAAGQSEKLEVGDEFVVFIKSILASKYSDQGEVELMAATYEEVLLLTEKLYGENSNQQVIVLNSYALNMIMVDEEKAYSLAQRALKISQKSKEYIKDSEQIYNVLSILYIIPDFKHYNLDSALIFSEKKVAITKIKYGINSYQYLNSINSMITVLMLKKEFEIASKYAVEFNSQSLKYFGKGSDLYRASLSQLAEIYENSGDIPNAEIYYLELNNWWQEFIKSNYISLVGNIHENEKIRSTFERFNHFVLVNWTELKNNQTKIEVYQNQLLFKNLQLNHLSSIRKEIQNNAELNKTFNEYTTLVQNPGKEDNSVKIKQLERELYSGSPAFKTMQEGKNITDSDITARLNSDEISIEFARYYDQKKGDYIYMALILKPKNPVPFVVKLGNEDSIEMALSTVDLSQLYKLVWEPMNKELGDETKKIFISPAFVLNNVPFYALCESSSGGSVKKDTSEVRGGKVKNMNALSDCAYLMDHYDLHILSSTRNILNKPNPILPKKPSVLILGGVDYENVAINSEMDFLSSDTSIYKVKNKIRSSNKRGGSSFDYLAGTEKETDEIVSLLRKISRNIVRLKGKEASENTFKSNVSGSTFNILHFATHGFSFPEREGTDSTSYSSNEDPLNRCGLVLAGGNQSWKGNYKEMIEKTGQDGILTGKEIVELPLSNTRLVVLSACETGIGKIEGIEGSFSLNRAFLLTGVDYVISSLWSVPDKETKELMTFFYSKLAETRNIEIAFQYARKEMRTLYPDDPQAWAGFVLVR